MKYDESSVASVDESLQRWRDWTHPADELRLRQPSHLNQSRLTARTMGRMGTGIIIGLAALLTATLGFHRSPTSADQAESFLGPADSCRVNGDLLCQDKVRARSSHYLVPEPLVDVTYAFAGDWVTHDETGWSMADGNPVTVWKPTGSPASITVRFAFQKPATVTQVGTILAPHSQAATMTWNIGRGETVRQSLSPTGAPPTMSVPATTTPTVLLNISPAGTTSASGLIVQDLILDGR